MNVSPLAGHLLAKEKLINVTQLEKEYVDHRPDFNLPNQRVIFGTSGHRGSPLRGTFNEAHVLAISQAICDYRKSVGVVGPLHLGKDTHALSRLSQETVVEVLAANEVEVFLQQNDEVTPTPAISHAILVYNRGRMQGLSDGIIITPSHNSPEDGGYKYNPTNGGPADATITSQIEKRSNELLADGNKDVKRISIESAMRAATTHLRDFMLPYVQDLSNVVDMDAVTRSNLKLGVDPLGGTSLRYWECIKDLYKLDLTIVNPSIDPTFSFIPADHDGQIRMDCSSPYPMTNLIKVKGSYDLGFGNDPDSDRFGVVTPSKGLMNPNHFLTSAIHYLLSHRPHWPANSLVGKTVVTSESIDRVVHSFNREVSETPVGFKWFAAGLFDASYCFGGEESAGASFLRKNGTVWTTDKDGLLMNLLAIELTTRSSKDPGQYYDDLTEKFGAPLYTRIDVPITPELKHRLAKLRPDAIKKLKLADEPILTKLSSAPGNQAPIGGIKIITKNGWFAARPSGTEDVYKIYAESFKGQSHLDAIVAEAREIVTGGQ